MTCRAAKPDDAAALKALHLSSWRTAYGAFAPLELFGAPLEAEMDRRWDHWPKERLIRVLEADGADGVIEAFAAVEFTPTPYLDNLHVSPTLKGRGRGMVLMADLAGHLLELGHSSLALTVIEGNAPARAFYARCGGREGFVGTAKLLGHLIQVVPLNWDHAALCRLAVG